MVRLNLREWGIKSCQPPRWVPQLEWLEERCTPSSSYTITGLGTLGGSDSLPADINATGQVVGRSYTGSGTQDAFLWSNGSMTDLGTLGGYGSTAQGINATGQVVGYAAIASGAQHAFLWSNGSMTDLGTLGGGSSQANDISATGQVVGISDLKAPKSHAFLWSNGSMTDLGTLKGDKNSDATAINDTGQVVGYSFSSGKKNVTTHAFLWSNGSMTDLGTLGGSDSYAFGINATGQVVGYSATGSGMLDAFLWSNGSMTDLGTLGGTNSVAEGINAAGQVVGFSITASGATDAFLWANGTMTDLNTLVSVPGVTLSGAVGINDSGQIACTGTVNGLLQAILLTPVAVPAISKAAPSAPLAVLQPADFMSALQRASALPVATPPLSPPPAAVLGAGTDSPGGVTARMEVTAAAGVFALGVPHPAQDLLFTALAKDAATPDSLAWLDRVDLLGPWV
jgi:probable HAF family extracellular repeat protein